MSDYTTLYMYLTVFSSDCVHKLRVTNPVLTN